MIIINDIEQSSDDWFRLKAGVISASRAAEFSSEPKLAPMPDECDFHYMKEKSFLLLLFVNHKVILEVFHFSLL